MEQLAIVFFTRKKIGFTIYVILSQLCVNCRADADAVILHHNSGLGDMITILTMHRAMMHHYLTVIALYSTVQLQCTVNLCAAYQAALCWQQMSSLFARSPYMSDD